MPSPRVVTLLALLALGPVAVFATRDPIVAVAAVNVLLITGSLWYAFGGAEEDAERDGHPS